MDTARIEISLNKVLTKLSEDTDTSLGYYGGSCFSFGDGGGKKPANTYMSK